MNDLLTYLRRLAKQLNDNIVLPNRGGCCVISAEIAEHLERIVPVRIRVSNDWVDEDDDCNLNEMVDYLGCTVGDHDAWNDNDIAFGHVIVEFDYNGRTYHMDTSGVKLAKKRDPSFGWLMYDGHLPLHAAKALAAQQGNWNKKFNRAQIPRVKKIVEESFAQLPLTQIAV